MTIRFLLVAIFWSSVFATGANAQSDNSNAATSKPTGQNEEQVQQTLKSFRKLDEHPLFEMEFFGDYAADTPREATNVSLTEENSWACSIFVSFGKDGSAIYGRNFDWLDNPALVLHTHPSNGYASISMVDISYLGFARKDQKYDSVEGRRGLLAAPMIPFDGMNEHGLVVGMAAVGPTQFPMDAAKPSVGSLQIIRLMLDRTKTVDEALVLFQQYNIQSVGGPNIHYLVADASGNSAVIELKDNETHIHRGQSNWQSATNFYLTGEKKPLVQCRRFAQIHQTMLENKGDLNLDQTFKLLKNVSQRNTRWSAVYDMQAKTVDLSMSRHFNKRTRIKLQSSPVIDDSQLPISPKKQ